MFATTRWSLVAAAQDAAAPESRQALADLCAAYWYPVYAYVRRRGHDHHAAQDLTQAFFARRLQGRDPARLRRRRRKVLARAGPRGDAGAALRPPVGARPARPGARGAE